MDEPRIVSVEPLSKYRLLLHFSTGEKKVFDVTPYLKGSWFGQLKDTSYFTKVQIIANGEGVAWPDGQDIAPHELYELSRSVSTASSKYLKHGICLTKDLDRTETAVTSGISAGWRFSLTGERSSCRPLHSRDFRQWQRGRAGSTCEKDTSQGLTFSG